MNVDVLSYVAFTKDRPLQSSRTRPYRPGLRAVECDPAIVTLPGVSTRPLAPVRVPGQISPARRTPDWPSPSLEQQSPLGELARTWSSRSPWENHRPRHSR
jgi:hypothetical protein